MLDMTRCCSTSQATRSALAAVSPRRGPSLRATSRAGARMIDPAPFGDVMQERREIKLGAMGDLRHDFGGERQFLAEPSRFDAR